MNKLALFFIALVMAAVTMLSARAELVLNVTFDDQNTTGCTDFSVYHHASTLHNTTYSASEINGYGMNFRGWQQDPNEGNDYCWFTYPTVMANASMFTCMAWMKPAMDYKEDGTDQWKFYLMFQPIQKYLPIAYGTWAGGNFEMNVWNNSDSNYRTYTRYITSFNKGQWYHVASTYNGTNLTLFINGQVVATGGNANYSNISGSTYGFFVGAKDQTYANRNYTFNGTIDEVKCWNQSLATSEVQTYYNEEYHRSSLDDPVATEVGILPGCNTADGCFGYANYSSPVGNLEAGSSYNIYKNGVNFLSGKVGKLFYVPYSTNAISSDAQSPFLDVGTSKWSPGYHYENSLNLSGSSCHYYDNPQSTRFDPAQGTIYFWVYQWRSQASDDYDRIFSYHEAPTTDNFEILFDANVKLYFETESGDSGTKSTSSFYINDSRWHFVTVTWNSLVPVNTGKIYLDGVLQPGIINNYLDLAVKSTNFSVGCKNLGGAENANVQIEDFTILNRTIGVDEVRALYRMNALKNDLVMIPTESFRSGDTVTFEITHIDNASSQGVPLNSSTQAMPIKNVNVSLDFSAASFNSALHYGSHSGLFYDKNTTSLQNNYASTTEYVKIWVDNGGSSNNHIIPFINASSYDFANLTAAINNITSLGLVPYLVFSYAPNNLTPDGSGSSSEPPVNVTSFAEYFKNTTVFLNSNYDISKWYLAIYNEPMDASFWGADNNYTSLVNATFNLTKQYVPGAKICAETPHPTSIINGSVRWTQAEAILHNVTNLDCISIHPYGITNNSYSFDNTSDNYLLMNDTHRLFNKAQGDFVNLAKGINPGIEVINSEFNVDSAFTAGYPFTKEYNRDAYGAAWLASAIRESILVGNITLAVKFTGTGSNVGGWGSWNTSNFLFPAYYVQKDFLNLFPFGSSIVQSSSSDDMVEVLAGKNVNNNSFVLINKRNASVDLTINTSLASAVFTNVNDTSESYTTNASGFLSLSLSPYEVVFYRSGSAWNISIISPESERTYVGGSIGVRTFITSANPLSACYLSLDGGTNQSFDCSSADVALVQHMRHSLDIYAVDIAGYSAVQRVYFTSQASQGGGGSSGGVMPQPLQESNASQVVEENETIDYPNARIEFLDRTNIPVLTEKINDYLESKDAGFQVSATFVFAIIVAAAVVVVTIVYQKAGKW